MLFFTWLRNWKRSLECRWRLRQVLRQRPTPRRVYPRIHLEALEDRDLLSTYTVTSFNDSGVGTLRDAITQADMAGSPITEIDFNIGAVGSAQTINPASALPALTANNVFINALSQGGSGNTTPLIELNGASAGSNSDGLLLDGSNCTVSGLIVENFGFNGIEVAGSNNTIGGTAAGAGNVLSANGESGLFLDGGASGVVVQGNSIGTNAAGTAALGNGVYGIVVEGPNNTIGGTVSGARNIISGNNGDNGYGSGINLDGASGNLVQGNFIGTNAAGTSALGNGYGILDFGNDNTIGGTTAAARNIISGNTSYGVTVSAYSSGNLIEGNYIGTDVTGASALPNVYGGVIIGGDNTLGGTVSGAGNVISGNGGDGVEAAGGGASFTSMGGIVGFGPGPRVQGNFIGLNASGTADVGNGGYGVEVYNFNNTIGGTAVGAGNIISGNSGGGVYTTGNSAVSDLIEGNSITFDVITTADNGNNNNPVAGSLRWAINQVNADQTDSAANPDTIAFNITAASDAAGGGTGYNATTGVAIIQPQGALPTITNSVVINGYTQAGASENTLALGDNAVIKIELRGNSSIATGLELSGSSSNGSTIEGLSVNSFGGSTSSDSMIGLDASNGDIIQGNFIGLDASGESSPASGPNFIPYPTNGSQFNGILLQDAQNDLIGTNGDGVNDPAERNVLSNCAVGVAIESSSNNAVAGNYIGIDASGTKEIGNWDGLAVAGGSSSNRIGTSGTDPDAAGEGNVISGNEVGISFASGAVGSPAETGGTVEGNMIGPDAYGNKLNGASGNLTWQGNVGAGIGLLELDSGIQIGGSNPVQANIIAYNQGPGVSMVTFRNETATHITVQGNSIYDNLGPGIDEGGTYSTTAGLTQGPDNASSLSTADGPGTGPNDLQHYPPLTSAQAGSSTTTISGSLSTNNAGPYTLDFYDNGSSQDPSGYGQGKTYLGSAIIPNTGSFTVILPVATAAGDYLTATATNAAGDTSIFSNDIQAAAPPAGQTFSQNLQAIMDQSSPPSQVTLQADPTTINDVVSGLSTTNLGSSVAPVSVYLNLAPGTYQSQTIQAPQGMTLYINGQQGTTIDPATPALTVVSGTVIVSNVTLVSTGDAPTILVTGGNVTLHEDDVVQSSTVYTDPAIAIAGGTVNLGTATTPGNNTLSVNNSGNLISNSSGNAISAVGDTFVVGGTVETAPNLSFTLLTSSAATSLFDESVTLTATVQTNGSSIAPTGNINFFDTTTNTDLGSVPLSGGIATLATSSLTTGDHSIVAKYSGDASFLPSANTLLHVVNKAMPIVSVTDAGGTYNGNPFAAAATLTGVDGHVVSSLEGVSLTLDYEQLDSKGNVIQDLGTTAPTAAGSYRVTASFAGSTDYLAASSSAPFAIAQATPIFGLVTPPTVVAGTSNTQITGSIAAGSLIPPGSVTVTINGVTHTATIDPANGTFAVSVPTASLGTGSYNIVYNYAGSNNFSATTGTATMSVANGILALFDQDHAKKAGSTIPIQIELISSSGQDVSSANTTVTALGMAATTDTTDTTGSIDPALVGPLQPVQASGNSNPNNVFREQGGSQPFYMYNLKTSSGQSAGTYRLYFQVQGDPLWHWVTFSVD